MSLFLKYLYNLSETGYWYERALVPELKRFAAAATPESVVLDFGCGAKPFARHLAGAPGRYIGIDVYPGARVDIVYDGLDIPLPDESVDLVFSSSVFEHVERLPHSLGEIARVLRPGGMLVGVIPFFVHVHGSPHDYHRPTRYGWASMLQRAFPGAADIMVRPVDDRLTCIGGVITAQINSAMYDVLRAAARRFRKTPRSRDLEEGAASPEGGGAGLKLAYALARLNPINFVIGLVCWAAAQIPTRRPVEGEISSGYLVRVVK